jgi:hypothetical protein
LAVRGEAFHHGPSTASFGRRACDESDLLFDLGASDRCLGRSTGIRDFSVTDIAPFLVGLGQLVPKS